MKVLELNSITGIFNEFYSPIDFSLIDRRDLKNLNHIFWMEILDIEFIVKVLEIMKNSNVEKSIWEYAILSDEKYFIERLQNTYKIIAQQAITANRFFSELEVLEIYCKVLSKYYFKNYNFNIQDGFQFPNYSIKKIDEEANKSTIVFDFVNNMIDKMDCVCDFLWINGTVNFINYYIIKRIKEINPNCFIGLRYHNSEYFSYSKIKNYLKNNNLLFNVIDCIVLDDNLDTTDKVENFIKRNLNLSSIENIMYLDKNTNEIIETNTLKKKFSFFEMTRYRFFNEIINTEKIVNLRLLPNKQCYWKKCTFCGINKKYLFCEDTTYDLETNFIYIKEMINKGYKYFWFEDEAIPSDIMIKFADFLLVNEIEIFWQIRSRFDINLNKADCDKLFLSGLREIRFGFESGSNLILKKMNKYESSFDYNNIEALIKKFSQAKIHVHVPTIVGFPFETMVERKETYERLQYLNKQYNMTFNINIFLLDVASDVFKNFDKYNIKLINFRANPFDFIDNFVNYELEESYNNLDKERNEFMRDILYPWMPKTALIKPVILYRLSETIRNTLLWSNKEYDFILPSKQVTFILNNHKYIYDWKTHKIFISEN